MPRILPRAAVLVAALALFARPASAQAPDPLDLARGLRENGMADLALEYLDQLAAKNSSPALAAVLPLERAKARLDAAAQEPEEARRDALIARAKAEFEQFLAANPDHPRRAEAALALARVVSAQAKAALTKANKIEDDARRKSERAKTRPLFADAANRFGQAAAAFAKKLDDPDLPPARKKQLARDAEQAEMDRAVNAYMTAETYDPPEGLAEKEARAKAFKQAEDLFLKLSTKDGSNPLCWVAAAWAGECQRDLEDRLAMEKKFDEIRAAAKKNPAAAAGLRQVQFFEARAQFLAAGRDPAALRKAQAALEQWLADAAHRGRRPTEEVFAARWYLAVGKQYQAEALVKPDPKTKQPVVPSTARELLRQAKRDFDRLVETENDYSTRAAERRTRVIRLLIGDAEKDPAKINSFDEASMAAQVQMYKAFNPKEKQSDEDRVKAMKKAAALYERALALPLAKDEARQAADARANLVFAYLNGDRPYEAAVLGEHLAHTTRSSGPGARAGLYAVQAYLKSADKLRPEDAEDRKADRERAARVALYLDKQFPADPSTDAARVVLGSLLLGEGRHREAFDLLARVNPGYPRVVNARLLEGVAAFELLRPRDSGADAEKPALTKEQLAQVYRRIITDLKALPEPPASAPADDARLSVVAALQLAELYLTDKASYPLAERAVADAKAKVAKFTDLPADDKQELLLKAEGVRLRALFAEAVPLYHAQKYSEAVAKVAPALAEAAKNGPAVKAGQPEPVAAAAKQVDAWRRDKLLVLALQARIKEGAVDKVGELFDLMKKLGGSLEASIGALQQLIAAAKPQIEALRKEGKTEEADRLAAGVALVLDKVAAEPNITPKVLVALGAGLKDMGRYDDALGALAKVPAPPEEDLKKKPADLDDKARSAVVAYRAAKLEVAQTHRLAKQFDKADAVLAETMGTKEKPGWAANLQDYRRETAYLLEDKAEAAKDPKEANKLWAEALSKWREMQGDYLPTLRKLQAGKKDARSAFVALLELKQLPPSDLLPKSKDADGKPQPASAEAIKKDMRDDRPWVSQLLTERVKDPDGKEHANPVAAEYVRSLRNTATRLESQVKPLYHDLFFEYCRCLARANANMLKGKPMELPGKLAAVAKLYWDLERANPDLAPEVKDKFAGLMQQYPVMKQEYEKLGKPEPLVATAATTNGEDGGPATNGTPSATEPAKTPAPDAPKTAAAPPSEGDGGTGLLIGGLAGLVALAAAGYFVFLRRKKAPPAPRRSANPAFFENQDR